MSPRRSVLLLSLMLGACRSPGQPQAGKQEAAASARPRPAPSASAAEGPPAGRRVQVVARHELGVPLHPRAGASEVSGRLADGAWVSVLEQSADGRWLRVSAADGLSGWLTTRYTPVSRERHDAPAQLAVADGVWSSPEACRRRVHALVQRKDRSRARLMSFNVRWFPDGAPGKRAGEHPTDIAWLACALAASNVDVVLLQEIKATARARAKLAELIDLLDELTGGSFAVELDSCPNPAGQHVGLLFDRKRARASHFQQFASLNPHDSACKDQLRPGFGGYFEFPGGLDLHLVSVHLKSGSKRRDHELRLRSLRGMSELLTQATNSRADRDIVIGGDWNTMGCRHCSPPLSAAEERGLFEAAFSALPRRLRLLGAALECTEYFAGEGALLDHFVVSPSLEQLGHPLRVDVSGICGALECRKFRSEHPPRAFTELSDHCPIVLELHDRDLD